MPVLTLIVALTLIALGPIGYALSAADPETAKVSMTVWIPSFLGLPLMILALVAFAGPKARKHAMHGAMVIALLGIFGSAGRAVPGWITLLSGGEVELPLALTMQSIAIAACLVLVVFGVKSFIDARRAAAAEPVPAPAESV